MAKHMAGKHYRGSASEQPPRRKAPKPAYDDEAEQFSADPERDDAPPARPSAPRRPAPAPKKRRSPVIPIVIFLIVAALGIIVYILWSLGMFGGSGILSGSLLATPDPAASASAAPTPTAEPTPSPTPSPTPEPTPPPIYDDGTEGYMSSGICIYNNQGFEMFYGDDSMAATYAEMINALADQLSGMEIYNMVVPNHSEFGLPERVREYYGESSQRQNISTIYENLSDSVTPVDVYDILNLHNNENIYFGTDTHWAPLGAYYAYTVFCETAGVEPAALESFDKTSYEFTGYLAYATGEDVLYQNPDTLDVYDPTFDYTCEMSYDGPELLRDRQHQRPRRKLRLLDVSLRRHGLRARDEQHALHGRKLLIVKDSYGNAMAPFLTASFDEVHVVDFRYFEDNLPSYCESPGHHGRPVLQQ